MRARSYTRRQFLKASAASGAAAATVLGVDATVVEPHHPQLRRVEITLETLPHQFHGFTIAQLSDFHYDPHFCVIPIRAAVKMVNALNPDLIVLTGDFVTVPMEASDAEKRPEAARQAGPCAKLLGELRARFGSVAVLGNHDEFSDPDEVAAALRSSAIRVLRNENFPLQRGNSKLWLAGVNDVLGGGADIGQAISGIPDGAATVALCHEPDYADHVARYPIGLQLSGHSHGGQVRFPIIGPPFLPRLARKYPWGLRQVGRMMLYTNCGIGTIRVPVRWNCPPEVTMFTLRAAGAPGKESAKQNG